MDARDAGPEALIKHTSPCLTTPGRASTRMVFSANAGFAAGKRRTVIKKRKYSLTGWAHPLHSNWPHGSISNAFLSILMVSTCSPHLPVSVSPRLRFSVSLFPRVPVSPLPRVSLSPQPIQEHSISLLAPLIAGQPEEFVGRVRQLILQAKGKDDGVSSKDLEEQSIGRDGPAGANPVGFLAVEILEDRRGNS